MFSIYALIRKLTGQDSRSMTADEIKNQLDFVEPQTAPEYIQTYGLEPDDLIRRKLAFNSRQRALREQQQLI